MLPLWEERFKSVLVGGTPGALTAVAAYIDLNAVRAGIVGDPKDYRFCGYGEAMGGSKQARDGLCRVLRVGEQEESWDTAAGRYRELLYPGHAGVRERGVPTASRAFRASADRRGASDAGWGLGRSMRRPPPAGGSVRATVNRLTRSSR